MSLDRFDGVLAPVVTPFDENLAPDAERFTGLCHWLLGQGVKLAVFGTTSEANSLSTAEKIGLLERLLDSGVEPDNIMPGAGLCSLSETVEFTAAAAGLGCPRVLMLPPFYYKNVSDDGLFGYMAEVIDRVGREDLQIYLYHFPAMSRTPYSLDLDRPAGEGVSRRHRRHQGQFGQMGETAASMRPGWPHIRVFLRFGAILLQNMEAGGRRLHFRHGN